MTEPLARPLTTENRMLRATGSVSVPLGAALGAEFSMPRLGGLAAQQIDIGIAGNINTFDQTEQRWADEQQWRFEMAQLTTALESALPEEEAGIHGQIEALEDQRRAKADTFARDAVAAGKYQDPAALNEQYKDYGVTFAEPTTAEAARLIAEGKKAEIIRDALVAHAPSGFLPGAAMFGSALLSTATDPLELATMFIPVVGQAGRAAAVARFGRVGGYAAVGAVEGAVGSALTEPLYLGLSRSQQLDYSMQEALLNVGLGAVLGGGIGGAIGAFARAAPDAARVADVEIAPRIEDPEASIAAFRQIDATRRAATEQRVVAETALRQFATGQTVKVDAVMPRLSTADALSALNREITTTAKYPIAAVFKKIGIHPEGRFAGELRAMGITNKTMPGLFSRGGKRDLDNLVASELEQQLPGISAAVGVENGYLLPDRLAQVLGDELTRGASSVRNRAAVATEIDEINADTSRLARVFEDAKAQGFALRSEEELRFVDNLLRRGDDMGDDLEKTAIRFQDQAADLARHGDTDPLADYEASQTYATAYADDAMTADLEDMDRMIAQMYDFLDADLRAEVDGIAEIQQRAVTYAKVAEDYATCLAGGR